jgi:hypothetical protein
MIALNLKDLCVDYIAEQIFFFHIRVLFISARLNEYFDPKVRILSDEEVTWDAPI